MKKILLAVIVVSVPALLLWMHREDVAAGKAARTASASNTLSTNRSLSTDAVLSIVPGAKRSLSAAPTPPALSPAMREYVKAREYKPVYDRLRNAATRTAEEDYILAEILERCAKVTDRKDDWGGNKWKLGGPEARARFLASLPEKDPARAKRLAAFDDINYDRCAGIADVSVTEKEIRDLLASASATGDPKARARLVERELADMRKGPDGKTTWDPARTPTISDAQIETLKQAAQSRDPYAIVLAMTTLNGWLGNLSLRTGEDQMPVEGSALYSASTLVACEYGMPCGPDSPRMLEACAMQGRCGASDYRDYLFYYGITPNTAQMVGDYQLGLARAVRDGDWSYFTFHPGPSPFIAPYQSR
jgi:hypothetical protein